MLARYNTYLTEDMTHKLVKEEEVAYGDVQLVNPDAISDFFKKAVRLHEATEEHVYIICTTIKNQPIGFFEISHGGVDFSFISPADVFRKCLLIGAKNFALVHNHPSQDVTPSQSDFAVTRKIYNCAKMMDINFIDHIIVGKSTYSFRLNTGIFMHEAGITNFDNDTYIFKTSLNADDARNGQVVEIEKVYPGEMTADVKFPNGIVERCYLTELKKN